MPNIHPLGRINGDGYIIDGPGNKIHYHVEPIEDQGKIKFVLKMANRLTWWKSLDIFVNVNGRWEHSKRIETKDAVKEASVDYFEHEMTTAFKIEFWKGGFAGFGAYVVALQIDSYENRGNKLTFTWERD